MTGVKLLIVEDDPSILEALQYNFQKENFEVHTAADGRSALEKCQSIVPDIVLLDLMIPGFDGLQVCRQIRNDPRTRGIRVIMVTAKGEETDEIVGFNLGADDYVPKPFRMKPLIERVKALLRRNPADEDDSGERLTIEGIEIDRVTHMSRLDGQELLLTPTEFNLLWTLARQPGRTFKRNELLDWSRGEDANSMERTIDVHVRALRKKLGDKAVLIETVRGIGYRFRPRQPAS